MQQVLVSCRGDSDDVAEDDDDNDDVMTDEREDVAQTLAVLACYPH